MVHVMEYFATQMPTVCEVLPKNGDSVYADMVGKEMDEPASVSFPSID